VLPVFALFFMKALGANEVLVACGVILTAMPAGSTTALLAQKYGADIDDHNARISKVEVRPNTGIILPKGKKTESLDSLEVAGADTRHIIQMKDGTMVYMIQPGDTLSSISATLGYSVDELANFNQVRNVNLIYANSALRIPKNN
jgi:LysM repeat protein